MTRPPKKLETILHHYDPRQNPHLPAAGQVGAKAMPSEESSTASHKRSIAADQPAAPELGLEQGAVEKRPTEIGGPSGPEPTRYGDWERNGRVSDF